MNRWGAVAILLAFAGALALRFPNLEKRPLHNDEAVNATKVAELWQNGKYRYEPEEYHGPTLHYATVPFLWLSGANGPKELRDGTFRWAPVVFGAGLILLLPLFSGGIPRSALLWAALFVAISPAMVFYSRYFIHEMLLIFFTAWAIGAGWRYTQTTSARWAILCGIGVGLMFATKETFVLSIFAMSVAGTVTAWTRKPNETAWRNWVAHIPLKHLGLALGAALLVWLLFFSSFFTNFGGLMDSVLTYFPWLKRAGGDSPHIHSWYFYWQRLAWFDSAKGPVWSEALILLLALVGCGVALLRKGSPLLKFVAVYTVVLATVYSAISYKTPWCLLGFYHGMILLAGVGAATLIEGARRRVMQVAITVILLAFSGQLGMQAWHGSYVYVADSRNPYVYAQTVPDILNLVKRAEGIAHVSAERWDTVVKVVAPESDYWPLPWYLRRFNYIGWYEKVPEDWAAPIVIVSSKFDARLDEKSDGKWLMAGLTEMRPRQFFELYVELELWKKYVETLPPEPD